MKRNITFHKIKKLRIELSGAADKIMEYLHTAKELEDLDPLWESDEYITRAASDSLEAANRAYRLLKKTR